MPNTLSLTTIRTFNHVRARFQRLEDGTWHAGWVTHLDHRSARIRMQAFVSLLARERVACLCYGDRTKASFEALTLAQAGQDVALDIVGVVTFEPSLETVRIRVDGVAGTLFDERGETGTLMAMDVSPLSLGGLSDRGFTPGSVLGCRLQTMLGEFEGTLRVVNCRRDETQAGCYRLGLLLVDAPRLSRALWNRMLEEAAGR